ncbi:MAG: phosphomannose isomerase type II C-terminal cupin domain [Nanoarchaeota archaeon]|nr:phosphomannose isomerase type II C-terminal cupin domain [Nanoarchaeota archaeon]MBU1622744.1 phosphomannose isomerase type II C-terminal cupin domain [Nanoarchaeota archaeon]MBU1974608.1 phosphomannose isomerase type II C-terminal cupin domain [Nanoarchaeota archaeon]
MKQFTIKKPWGLFLEFTLNEKSTVKILEIAPQEMLSLQSHRKRAEFWYVLEGSPTIVLNTKTKKYQPGETIKVKTGMKHRIINKTGKRVRILEIATGNFDENDIIRYQDKYQRIKNK